MPKKPALSQTAILVLRILMLFVAGAATLLAVVLAFSGRESNETARYVCPMHSEVRTRTPGECPICRMALEAVASGVSKSKAGALPGIPDMMIFENVRDRKIIDFVRVHSLPQNLREMRGPARVESEQEVSTLLYNDQIAALSERESGSFTLTAAPEVSTSVVRSPGAVVPWDSSTSIIHFRFDSKVDKRLIRVGDVGWLHLPPKPRAVLGVPTSAVLQEPRGPYVLAFSAGPRFEKRSIQIGELFVRQGFAVVLSGLKQNDRIVSKAAFFVDAERRLSEEPPGDIAQ